MQTSPATGARKTGARTCVVRVPPDRRRGLAVAMARGACIPLALGAVAGLGMMLMRTSPGPRPPARIVHVERTARPTSTAVAVLSLRPPVPDESTAFDEDYDPDQARITWARRILEDPQGALAESGDVLKFGPMRVSRDLAATIVRAAAVTQMDAKLLMAIADKESSFAPNVQARTSSARGLFQFIDTTWLRVMRDYGPTYGFAPEAASIIGPDDRPVIDDAVMRRKVLDLRDDPYLATLFAAEMLKHDAARIAQQIGRPLSDGEIYLAHFLGPSDAQKFIAKLIEEPKYAAQKLLPRPARANRPIFFHGAGRRAAGLSVADVHRKFEEMMGLRSDRYRDVTQVTGASAYADDDQRPPPLSAVPRR